MPNNIINGVTMEYAGNAAMPLVYEPLFRNPMIERFFSVLDNVQSRQPMPIIGALQKITRKYAGCGLTITGNGVSITERALEVERMESHLEHCPDIFNNTLWEKARRSGADINNIEGTEIERIILNIVGAAIQDDLWRQTWFGDTASSDPDYNAYDGVWKMLIAGVDADQITRTIAIGDSLNPNDAKEVLQSLIRNAPNTLKQIPKSQVLIPVTGSLFDNLLDSKLSMPAIEPFLNLERLDNGFGDVSEWETTKFEGYTVVAVRSWDTWIGTDLAGNNPHRAILWVKQNHFLGTDKNSDRNEVRIWFSKDDDKNKTLNRYMTGYNYALPQLIAVAY